MNDRRKKDRKKERKKGQPKRKKDRKRENLKWASREGKKDLYSMWEGKKINNNKPVPKYCITDKFTWLKWMESYIHEKKACMNDVSWSILVKGEEFKRREESWEALFSQWRRGREEQWGMKLYVHLIHLMLFISPSLCLCLHSLSVAVVYFIF